MTQSGAHLDPSEGIRSDGEYPVTEQTGSDHDMQYDQLVGKSQQPKSLVRFFRESPLVGIEIDLTRQKDEGREIQL